MCNGHLLPTYLYLYYPDNYILMVNKTSLSSTEVCHSLL